MILHILRSVVKNLMNFGILRKNDAKLSELETKVIVEWFATCWNKAGGMNVTLPSYVSFHDDNECYDLHNGKWISDGDRWFD